MEKRCSRQRPFSLMYCHTIWLATYAHIFHSENHLGPFYCYACMSKMTLCALLFRTNIMNTPPKEDMKTLLGIRFVRRPGLFYISLQLGKEFLDGVEIWWVRRQVQQFDTCIRTQLLDSVRVVERGIIHYKHRFRFRPLSTVLEKLLYKRFEEHCISWPLKNTRQDDTILCVGWQDLIALTAVKLRYLDWCHA